MTIILLLLPIHKKLINDALHVEEYGHILIETGESSSVQLFDQHAQNVIRTDTGEKSARTRRKENVVLQP